MQSLVEKISRRIVAHRRYVLPVMLAAGVLCAILSLKVYINSDMTKYLSDRSSMKQGIDVMAEEFSALSIPSSIRVMLKDLPQEKIPEVLDAFSVIEGADTVSLTDTAQDGEYTLFTVTTTYDYRTKEERGLEKELAEAGASYHAVVSNDDSMGMDIPLHLYVIVVVILLFVLFALCASWLEPFLFLGTIGLAILINMGTNLILGWVSQTTYSIAAILQLILSMDYSIILMNRYRQEKDKMKETRRETKMPTGKERAAGRSAGTKEEAMARALSKAFPSVASSGFTTFVGLLMLVFMEFKIGKDIGLVLAKGVLCSMLCVWLVLPCLILLFDRQIARSAKPFLQIPTKVLAAFSYRFRYILAVGFVVLFALSWGLQQRSETSYSLSAEDPIAEIFPPENSIVLLYSNEDEEAAAALAQDLETNEAAFAVQSYATTLGRQMTAREMGEYITQMAADPTASALLPEEAAGAMPDQAMLMMLYALRGMGVAEDDEKAEAVAGNEAETGKESETGNAEGIGADGAVTMSLEELFSFASAQIKDNPLFAALVSEETKSIVDSYAAVLAEAKAQLVGEEHSIMMLRTDLPVESEETTGFIEALEGRLAEEMNGDWYLIGNSPMNVEMQRGFGREFLLISVLTAASIFLVVLVTFRNWLIPVVLVSLVQCGVFLTITTTWVLGYKMYYLAILIVQCILMGATVDYGILFTNYYRENRTALPIKEALRETYARSVHTILTSGLFMIFGTGVLGLSPIDPTISQICQSIALGAVSATVLVIFVLPGLLGALDRFVRK